MTRAVFPLVPDPLGARPLQSPTAHEIARIRAALPTGTLNGGVPDKVMKAVADLRYALESASEHDYPRVWVLEADLATLLEFIDS